MSKRQILIDTLESRTFFSVSSLIPPLPKHAGPKTTAAHTAAESAATALTAAEKTEFTDGKAYGKAVAALLKAPTATITADETAIKAAKAALNAVDTADLKQLITDGKALAAAFKAGNAALVTSDLILVKADITKLKTDAKSDGAAIETAVKKLGTDINASPTVAPLYAKVEADTTTLTADLKTFQTDLKTYLVDRKTSPTT